MPRRFDPLAFPHTGPDKAALKLQRQGAPGAPPRLGTCVVSIVCRINTMTGSTDYRARSACGRNGDPHSGADAQVLAERDARRLDGHACTGGMA